MTRMARYTRRFSLGLNLFAWSMLAAPLMSDLALLWVAVEVTTVISALLVAIEATDGAAEAAWKYVLIASAGLGIALARHDLHVLRRGAGPRAGLRPGLPSAAARGRPAAAPRGAAGVRARGGRLRHQGRPVPGAHLATRRALRSTHAGLGAAVRVAARGQLLRGAALLPGRGGRAGRRFPRDVLLVFGMASLLLAALYLLDQRDYKRLLAYSSMEHMGILAIGVSFGAPIALAGVLLHVLAHARPRETRSSVPACCCASSAASRSPPPAAAWTCCPGAARCSWRDPGAVRDAAVRDLPQRVRDRPRRARLVRQRAGRILVALVTVAFLGLALAATRMMLSSPRPAGQGNGPPLTRGEPSAWMVVPGRRGLVALLVLGLHPPGELTGLMARAVAQLGGTS